MMLKVLGVVAITAVFAVLGALIIRRNRRDRTNRALLAEHGTRVRGRIVTLTKVTAGKYGSYKLRAEIRYQFGGTERTHVAAWWPHEAAGLAVATTIDLLVDPDQPDLAVVAGDAAPDIENDAVWRWLTVGVAVVALALALVS